MASGIRLRYSGLVIFASKILSVATGLAFQYMLARSVSVRDYGVWFNVSDLTTYFTILAGVFPFWALRFTARAKEGAIKTALAANFAIASAAAFLYGIFVPTLTSALGIGLEYVPLYVLAAAQIVEVYVLNALESCLQAKLPHVIGYGLLIAELCKITLGYILIIRLQLSLLGALTSIIMGVAAQLTYYSSLLVKELKEKVKWSYIKEWIKGSVANIYYVIGNQIAAFIFILLFTYGGEAARGYYGAAAQIAGIITYASFLAFALYPRLLAEKASQDISTSLKMVLMFATPMAAGAIVMSKPLLLILKSEYAAASPILTVLALDSLVATVSTVFSFVVYGFEKVDEEARISLRKLAKSRLFVVFSLSYVHSAIAIPTALYVLANYAQNQPLEAALYVSLINSSVRFIMFLILYTIARRTVEMRIPWKNIAKYMFASTVMAATLYYICMIFNPTVVRITLSIAALGVIIYFAILMVIDAETRALFKDLRHEISLGAAG